LGVASGIKIDFAFDGINKRVRVSITTPKFVIQLEEYFGDCFGWVKEFSPWTISNSFVSPMFDSTKCKSLRYLKPALRKNSPEKKEGISI
jgi:hypothetical protein